MSIEDLRSNIEKDEFKLYKGESIVKKDSYDVGDTVALDSFKFYDADDKTNDTADFRWKVTDKETALGQTLYTCENKNSDVVLIESTDIKGQIVPAELNKDELDR